MTNHQIANLEYVSNLVNSTNGLFVDVNSALLSFLNKERKKKKGAAFKVPLQVGPGKLKFILQESKFSRNHFPFPDINIDVVGYIQVRKETPQTFKKCLASDSAANQIAPEVIYVRNNEDQDVVEKEDLIESYKYGSEIIAVSGKTKIIIFPFNEVTLHVFYA